MTALMDERKTMESKPNQPSQKQRLFSAKYLISMVFMLLILVVTFLLLPKDYSWSEAKTVILSAKPAYLLLGLLMMFIYQLCIARSIQLLINTFNQKKIPIELSIKTAFIGFYFNNITPSASGGQPVEMYYLNKRGFNLSHSSIIFIILAIFYNFSILGMSTLMLILKPDLIQSSLGFIRYFMYYGYLLNGGLTVLMICMIIKPQIVRSLLKGIAHLLIKWRLVKNPPKLLRQFSSFTSGYTSNAKQLLKQPLLLIRLFLLHLLQISALFCVPFFVSLALGGSHHQFGDTFALQSVLYTATSAVPTPGAVGITESGFITMFNTIMPAHQVLPGMFLTRVINLYGFLIISAIISIYAFIRVKHDRQKTSYLIEETKQINP